MQLGPFILPGPSSSGLWSLNLEFKCGCDINTALYSMLGCAAAELVNSNMEIYLMMFRVAAECVEHQCCMVHRASA